MISVIIPTYCSVKYLPQTLESVCNQSYPEFEILCIDDASTDDTVRIIEEFATKDSRIRLLTHPHNLGSPAFGRNTGLAEARGEFVTFLDHDDSFEPTKLERQLTSIHEQKVDFLCSNIYLLNHQTNKKDMLAWGNITGDPKKGFLGRLLQSNFVPPNSTLIRRSVFETVGVFDTSLKGVDDYDMWYRIVRAFPASILPEPLATWRYANTSSISSNEIAMLLDEIRFYEKITSNTIKSEEWEKQSALQGIKRDHWLIGHRLLANGNYTEAYRHYSLADKQAWADRVMQLPWAVRGLYAIKRAVTPAFSPLNLDFTPYE